MSEERIERDSMGEVRVPADARWGAQTQRAVENFPISGLRLERAQIEALARIKAAVASVKRELGIQEAEVADAIAAAADEVARGDHDAQFPIDVFQTGSGTSSNMNVNEVLASLAGERLGRPVHPNDDVNHPMSSNDLFPASIHLAATAGVVGELIPALEHLAGALESKAAEFVDVVKAGRTHLMDATPVTLGQEFGGYAAQVRMGVERLHATLPRVAELPLGGTAVGTGINAPPGFGGRVIAEVAATTGLPLTEARDHFEAQGARDALVELSGQLRTIAVSLTKVANDLRWMGSGPRAGLGRDQPARPAARQQHHARQGEPGDPRGHAHGVRAGRRQRRHHRLGGCVGELRAERHAAAHRAQPPRVDPAALQRLAPAGGPMRERDHRQRRAPARVRRGLARRS